MKLALLLPLAAAGCGAGLHRQVDHGRAYQAAFDAQADLTRSSAADAAYPLAGLEGLAIRYRVGEAAADAEEEETVSESESGR